jgi:hypothetical protein
MCSSVWLLDTHTMFPTKHAVVLSSTCGPRSAPMEFPCKVSA